MRNAVRLTPAVLAACAIAGLTLSQIGSADYRASPSQGRLAASQSQSRYWEVASDGGIFAFTAPFKGSMGGKHLNAPIVGMTYDSATGGYWEVASDGGIFAFTAPFKGSMGGKHLNAPIVGMTYDSATGGYWEVASDGGIFAFTAPFKGSMGGKHLNAPIVGMTYDSATGGYWEVASDGGIFAFTAPFKGSMGGKHLNAPIVGMTYDSATGGYWEVASDGGIFAFTAPFKGSMGGKHLNAPIVGMTYDSATGGYWEVASDGGIFAFTAPFKGSMGGKHLNAPIVGMTYDSATGGGTGTGTGSTGTGGAGGKGGAGGSPPGAGQSICGSSSLAGPATAPAGATTVAAGNDPTLTRLTPDTTYWFAPGIHTLGTTQYSQVDPAEGDTFLGAPGAVIDGQYKNNFAFVGTANDVTIEYLTIEDFTPPQTQGAVNDGSSAGWIIEHDTIKTVEVGVGIYLGSHDNVSYDCITNNAQQGFAAYSTTGTVSTVTLSHNEISFNDGTAQGKVGQYDHGGGTITCGCAGGGKFWDTENAVVTTNYVHTNGDVGIWVDTDNAGFDISGNYIANNYSNGIIYEISYNALISDNTFVGNGINGETPGFTDSALYVSSSGGDSRVNSHYAGELTIVDNAFTNNWGGVIVFETSNRYCGDGYDGMCTLITPAVYTIASCTAHLPHSTPTQNPDYYDNCRWKTQNVTVSHNTFSFNPATVGSACQASPTVCGYNGLFSQYGTTTPWNAYVVPLGISDQQNNHFTDNTYNGPWKFNAFTLGEQVTWAQWTAGFTDTTISPDHVVGQDAGSSYDPTPPARP